jgi:hypothetical protein
MQWKDIPEEHSGCKALKHTPYNGSCSLGSWITKSWPIHGEAPSIGVQAACAVHRLARGRFVCHHGMNRGVTDLHPLDARSSFNFWRPSSSPWTCFDQFVRGQRIANARPKMRMPDLQNVFLSLRKRTFGRGAISVALGHVWTVPAVQEESDFSAKRSGAAMYTAYCRLEDYLCRDAATVAAGPDVIR